MRGDTMRGKARPMRRGAVSGIRLPTVMRILLSKADHHLITFDPSTSAWAGRSDRFSMARAIARSLAAVRPIRSSSGTSTIPIPTSARSYSKAAMRSRSARDSAFESAMPSMPWLSVRITAPATIGPARFKAHYRGTSTCIRRLPGSDRFRLGYFSRC